MSDSGMSETPSSSIITGYVINIATSVSRVSIYPVIQTILEIADDAMRHVGHPEGEASVSGSLAQEEVFEDVEGEGVVPGREPSPSDEERRDGHVQEDRYEEEGSFAIHFGLR